ncbi:MAG: heparan-alpha-glucosaminide N-acetyltransferase domain-containing protein [Candidatus Humimicrobiaceae bacterium]
MLSENHNPAGRIDSIDAFRGFIIILMVIVNYLSGINCIPGFLKHASDIGLTITDLVAPAFIFAIGLTYKLSFDKRLIRDGRKKTYYHFSIRFLAFIGIGAFFTGGSAIVVTNEAAAGAWGVMQAIGAAGLITLLFIRMGTITRIVIGLVLLIIYQLMLDNFWLDRVLNSAQGGLQGALSWGAMLIISTALADLFHNQLRHMLIYTVLSLVVLLAGILSSLLFVVSKHRVSLSYVLISVGISALLFLLFDIFSRLTKIKLILLEWWGSNPLLLYLIHMILLGITFLPMNEVWYFGAPVWSALLQLVGFFSILCVFAWKLYSKKIHFTF